MNNDIPNYDSWKLSSGQEDEKVFDKCEQCGNEIYEGEEYLIAEDHNVHHECFEDFAWRLLCPIFAVASEDKC